MKIKQINHIGIVVENLETGKEKFGRMLGFRHLRDENVEEFSCKIAFFQCGDVLIELVEPTGQGPADLFLKTHGEGISHMCYEVNDILEALEAAKQNHATDYETPKTGAGGSKVFFLAPESCCGVVTEFVQLRAE